MKVQNLTFEETVQEAWQEADEGHAFAGGKSLDVAHVWGGWREAAVSDSLEQREPQICLHHPASWLGCPCRPVCLPWEFTSQKVTSDPVGFLAHSLQHRLMSAFSEVSPLACYGASSPGGTRGLQPGCLGLLCHMDPDCSRGTSCLFSPLLLKTKQSLQVERDVSCAWLEIRAEVEAGHVPRLVSWK